MFSTGQGGCFPQNFACFPQDGKSLFLIPIYNVQVPLEPFQSHFRAIDDPY